MKYKISSRSASCAKVSSEKGGSPHSPREAAWPVAAGAKFSCSGVCFAEVQKGGQKTRIPVFFGRSGKADDAVSGVSGVFLP